MTDVVFHFNVPERLSYACRLLRKICTQGRTAVVVASAGQLQQMDELLWGVSAQDFLGHVLVQSVQQPAGSGSAALARRMLEPVARIELAPAVSASRGRDVLVNLLPQVPQGFEQFQRLVDLVSHDEQERQQARQRWREYSRRGYDIQRHDVAVKGQTPAAPQ